MKATGRRRRTPEDSPTFEIGPQNTGGVIVAMMVERDGLVGVPRWDPHLEHQKRAVHRRSQQFVDEAALGDLQLPARTTRLSAGSSLESKNLPTGTSKALAILSSVR